MSRSALSILFVIFISLWTEKFGFISTVLPGQFDQASHSCLSTTAHNKQASVCIDVLFIHAGLTQQYNNELVPYYGVYRPTILDNNVLLLHTGFLKIIKNINFNDSCQLKLGSHVLPTGSIYSLATILTTTMKVPDLCYSSATLHSMRPNHSGCVILSSDICSRVKDLHIKRRFRGHRGRHVPHKFRQPSKVYDYNNGVHHNLLKSLPKSDYQFTTSNQINLALVNPTFIRNKCFEVLDHCVEFDYDLCFVVETWLKPRDCNIVANLQSDIYKLKHVPRIGKTGGGLGVLYKPEYSVKIVKSGAKKSFQFMECLVQSDSSSFVVVCLYRPPTSQSNPVSFSVFCSEFDEYLPEVLSDHGDPLILGDFNVHVNDTDNHDNKKFSDILSTYNLQQHVEVPTHISGHTIDLLITKCNSKYCLSTPTSDFFIVDHSFISTCVSVAKASVVRKTITYRRIKQLESEDFRLDLSYICKDLLSCSPSDLPVQYNTRLKETLNKHAPLVTKRVSTRIKRDWYTPETSMMKKDRRKLEKIWRKTNLDIDYDNFRFARNLVRNNIHQDKCRCINETIELCGNDSKLLFREVFKLTGRTKENPLPQCQSEEKLANEFTNFFMNKIETIRNNLDKYPLYAPCSPTEYSFTTFSAVEEEFVAKLIINSKPASCSLDPIPTQVLKDNLDVMVPVITKMVNSSLVDGDFYQEWKMAVVKPLLKKQGLDMVMSNYRPISNLSFVSKIVEKAALSQFSPYMEDHKLLPQYQSAYRRNFSTETALLKMVNDALCCMEKQLVMPLVVMDLSAAFDTVDHSVLLSVLSTNFGVEGTAYNWFTSYLTSRRMHTQVNTSVSACKEVSFSVPQGSVAGPVLYTAYASTLPTCIDTDVNQLAGYADDHGLYSSFKPDFDAAELDKIISFEEQLVDIKKWMDSNRLQMNSAKTEFIYFAGRQQLAKCTVDSIDVNSVTVTRDTCIKYLGAWLDQELNLKKHVMEKCKIAAFNIQNISSIRCHLSVENTKRLMTSLVLSHLDYSNGILYGASAETTNKMQSIQNWAAKVVLRRRKHDSSTECLKELHWLPILQRIQFKLLTLVFRGLHGSLPEYLQELLVVRQFTRTTRLSSCTAITLDPPKISRKTFAARSFGVAGPTLWNQLPEKIRLLDSYSDFRKQIKTYLFKEAFKL